MAHRRCPRTRLAAYVAVAAMVLAACSGSTDERSVEPIDGAESDTQDEDGEPEPEPDDEPEPEPDSDDEVEDDTDPEPDDPFAFDDPSEIDEAYVDAVMAELFAVADEVVLETITSDPDEGPTDDQLTRIRATNSGPRLVTVLNQAERNSTAPEVRDAFRTPEEFTGATWETGNLLRADDDCIAAIGFADTTGTASEPPDPDQYFVVSLSRMSDDQREEFAAINRTGWRQHGLIDLIYTDSGDFVPRDVWEELDFEDVADVEEFNFTCGQGPT